MDDLDSEDYPCMATMLRWLIWFQKNLTYIEGMLRHVAGQSITILSSSLLEDIRTSDQRWLEATLRIIYNSGGRLSPAC